MLQLETLEARTLLAGDIAAISASGSFVTSFDPAAPSAELSIATAVGGTLTIDANLLPEVVDRLTISGFETVTVLGTTSFERLELSHVGQFNGATLETGDLTSNHVAEIELHSIAGVAWLFGTETRLEVEDSRAATIVSDLDTLTISSKNDLNLLSTNPDQQIVVEFKAVKPSLTLPAKNVTFTDTASPSVDPEDTEPSPSYNVIIISLDGSMTAALEAALKRGDVDAIKSAFAELKSIQLADTIERMTFSVESEAEFNLAELRLAGDENAMHSFADAKPLDSIGFEAATLDPLGQTLDFGNESGALPRSIGSSIEGTHVFGPLVQLPDSLLIATPSDQVEASSAQEQRSENRLSLESIRSALSGLAGGASRSGTVSAYIISDVGTKLEPGELPGLLVEARSARSRREAIDWIEV